jgi:hypothetical protein
MTKNVKIPIKSKKAFVPSEEERAWVAASGHILTENLPFDYAQRDDDEMDEFVTDNVWEPFEGWPAKDIWFEISSIADTIMAVHKNEVKLKVKADKKKAKKKGK